MRNIHLCAMVVIALIFGACGDEEMTVPLDMDMPETITIQFHSVSVLPVKPDGCQWDGLTCSKVSDAQLADMIRFASDIYVSGSGYFTGMMADALAPMAADIMSQLSLPDPYAKTQLLFRDGTYTIETRTAGTCQDTLLCTYPTIKYTDVPYEEFDGLHVAVFDEDVLADDFIGSAKANRINIKYAYQHYKKTGGTVWLEVPFDDQGLIGIEISVY